MPLRFEVGQKFPDISLVDDRENEVGIAELAAGQPLLLVFYRGPW